MNFKFGFALKYILYLFKLHDKKITLDIINLKIKIKIFPVSAVIYLNIVSATHKVY